ncbi:MAG: hypothetical protein OXI02_01875 [Candidatus Dadabacteria bacterium]|nr:hypothetical protein [Candidatus Dadabacteria bacterium]MDE0476800.1 hypothetical protein [Candidatus Dadabacteria bacterium]
MPSDYDQIRADNIREYGEGTRHLSLLERLYTDRTHFIFELLQNAEDAGATRILFELSEEMLEVKHDGRPFNELDVRGVCGVGEGEKAEDLTQIGKFGIGFKSVYAYTSSPEVHSGDEHFRIEHYVRPCPADPKEAGDSWTTLFCFSFDVPTMEAETAFSEIAARLRNLSARTLLFLRRIKEIEYKLPDESSGVYLREEMPRGPARQVTVIGQNNGEDEDENWLVFEKPVSIPNSDYPVKVEVAFKLETDTKEKTEWITRIKDAPLVVYFPTEKPTRFGFLIQGPYRTTPSRDNIPKDDDWNTNLVEETASLLVDALINLRTMGLLTVSLLESMPIRMDDFPKGSMFFPITESVRAAFLEHELLPADDGTFANAKDAKLARGGDLRKLLGQEQLRSLFQSGGQVKWLVGTITRDRKPDLRTYLMSELGVEEITPDGFARKLSGTFLKVQPDDWMTLMYGYVGDEKALWQTGSGYWNPPGPLRSRPIIRLQDGSQVIPFREDGSPNAYLSDGNHTETSLPVVKADLCRHKETQQFLRALGIPELDLVEEVIEKVLPKYASDDSVVAIEEHQRDIIVIEKAYGTDSQEKKSRLRDRLCETPFVRAESQDVEEPMYRKPCELYFGSNELRLYFSGNNAIGFVNTEYPESVRSLFEDFGVVDSVRVSRKGQNGQGHVVLKDHHGWHERGLDGFDPDIFVEGLEIALASPTLEKSQFIWNNIAVRHFSCIRGVVESCPRQTYEGSTEEDRISEFGRLLIENTWLPFSDGSLKKPGELTLDDLPDSFIRDEKLAQQLGMKLDLIAKLAEETGVTAEDIELLKLHPTEFQQWKAAISAAKEKPAFPERASSDPERRREKLTEQLGDSPTKKYEQRDRSVRTTRSAIDPVLWLRNQYKNDAGQMICQICKEEMPFRKRDGEYYFEAVEALTKDHFTIEHEAQFLALCPLCSAMYKEFIKPDEEAMVELKHVIRNTDECEVPLRLGGLNTSIRFVEAHFQDIRTILEEQE